MHQQVGAARMRDQLPRITGVAGDDHRAPAVIHAVAERRLHDAVIDGERRHLQVAAPPHCAAVRATALAVALATALATARAVALAAALAAVRADDDFGGAESGAGGRQFRVRQAQFNVALVGLLQMAQVRGDARRAAHLQRLRAPVNPARQQQVGQADDVVIMQVRDEHRVQVAEIQPQFHHALGDAAPGVKQQFVIAGFNQHRLAETRHLRARRAGAEQRNHHHIGGGARARRAQQQRQ